MELYLKREDMPRYTIGYLYVDGRPFCDVLERKNRGLRASMSTREILARKVPGDTAIPAGRYRVTLKVRSPKFSSRPEYGWCRGFLPRLSSVPGFSGVLIHAGNTEKASRGCLLVGIMQRPGRLISSMDTLKRLYAKMQKETGEIWITISPH